MTKFTLDGANIRSVADFHRAFAQAPGVPSYYGHNISALWDVITTDLKRPYIFVWESSRISKAALGEDFDQIVRAFNDATEQDLKSGYAEALRLVVQE